MRAARLAFVLPAAALWSAHAGAATRNVATMGLVFSPDSITISAGDTVHWSYPSSHNIVQIDNLSNCNSVTPGGFNSGPVGSSTSFDHTFQMTGTFFYKCQAHCGSMMKGTVIVLQPCPGDTNGDRVVNFADLNQVLSQFGQSGAPGTLAGDVNNDGVVNFADLNIVLSNFGLAC